jgi:arylformamidase
MTIDFDPAFLDREYNPRLSVANVPELFAKWRERAKESRIASPNARLDLRFGEAAAATCDFFPATRAGGTAAPLLVFIHGGYWRMMDKADFSWVAPPFNQAGVAVAVPNYSLAPAATLETIVSEMRACLAWLWREGARMGFDRDRIVVAGHSAGGHLTAMMLATDWPGLNPRLPADLVKGGVSISGLFDLHPLSRAPFLTKDLNLDDARAAALSPALLKPATDAPLVTTVGGEESSEFHRQTALIRNRWAGPSIGADIALPGRNHFSACDALAEPGGPLFEACLELLEAAQPRAC